MSRISVYLFNLSRWSYLIYAALAALITALKGFFYAHLLDQFQYAEVNYYLLILGVGVLFIGSGVMVRCHTELPLLVKNSDSKVLDQFVVQVKWTGFLFWLCLLPIVFFGSKTVDLSLSLQALSIIQVLIFFLFTVDLMIVKSRLEFVTYAKQIFARNAVIAAAGFSAAYVTADAVWTVTSEVVCALLIYGRGLVSFTVGARLPTQKFLLDSLKFVPVTLVGLLLQFVDRLLASSVLPTEQFSRFSYFSLIVLAGLSIQQLVNTRVITVLPAMCETDPQQGFRYVAKASLVMGALLVVVLSVVMLILQSPWFSASWFERDYALGFLFVGIALFRSVDFYTSYLLVLNQKLLLFLTQIGVLLLFCIGIFLFKLYFAVAGLFAFVLMMFFGFFTMLIALFVSAWSVSRAGKNF